MCEQYIFTSYDLKYKIFYLLFREIESVCVLCVLFIVLRFKDSALKPLILWKLTITNYIIEHIVDNMSDAVILNIYCKQFIRHDRYMMSVERYKRKGLCEGLRVFFSCLKFFLWVNKETILIILPSSPSDGFSYFFFFIFLYFFMIHCDMRARLSACYNIA